MWYHNKSTQQFRAAISPRQYRPRLAGEVEVQTPSGIVTSLVSTRRHVGADLVGTDVWLYLRQAAASPGNSLRLRTAMSRVLDYRSGTTTTPTPGSSTLDAEVVAFDNPAAYSPFVQLRW